MAPFYRCHFWSIKPQEQNPKGDFMEFILSVTQVLCKGLGCTISLFLITVLASIPLGLIISFIVTGKNRVFSAIMRAYVFVMRGTPLMLQLFFFYYGLPSIPYIGQYITLDRFPAAALTFTLNYAAYFAEIFRGGLLSVDKGQYEAADVLGFSKLQTRFHVVLPQIFKVVLPSVSNEAITLIKDTALVTSIGIADLLHYTRSMVNHYVDVTPYFIAAAIYLLMTYGLTRLFKYLERRFMF